MNKTKITFLLAPFFTLNMLAQDTLTQAIATQEVTPKLSVLDSIKSTFVTHDIANCVDQEWMKELSNQELFAEIAQPEHENR